MEKKLELLKFPEYDTLTLEGVRELYMKKEKEQLLRDYKFPKKCGKDGYYRINVPDATKKSGRTTISAKTLEELKDKLYQKEKGITGKARKTFRDVFECVQEEKLKYVKDKEKRISVQNTISRNRSEYKRFFADTDFEKKFMDEISKKDVENIIYMNLSRYSIKKKAFASMKSLLRSAFVLAYEEYWIEDNVYLRVNFQKYEGMLEKDTSVENRCHSDDELKRMLEYIHEQQKKKPNYIPAYALEMQIIMGLRRGEVPPLEWKDVHRDYIDIVKEQLTVRKSKENPREYFVVVHHTKNHKDRKFPRTKDLDVFLERLEQMHKRYYPKSKYLFPEKNENGIITNNVVYKFYRRMCEKLDIQIDRELIKGTHSFRRNAITDVVNSTGGNVIMASQLFGNSPDVAKRNYYTGTDMENAVNVLNLRKLS